ncbi:MAG: DNA modification methylase [Planctomycetes bacterium]|nr:DNA modification methylase [Planctomycetota bacterium]
MEFDEKTMEVEWTPIERLHENPANPRHNDEAVPHVAASIKRFGWRQPVVARPSGEVIAGNTRLKAARSLGMTSVPVVWFDGPDIEATAFGIADNRTHEFAEWDEPALAQLLKELRDEDALDGTGYDDDDLDALIAELEDEIENDLDDPGPEEPAEKAVTQLGDLWVLGEHRLLCGDSTKIVDVERVLDGEKAALVATDPPYLVDYTGERPNDSGKDWSDSYREIDIKDAEGFFRALFSIIVAIVAPHAAVYCWHAHKRAGLIQRIWEEVGLLDHQQIVWVKPTSVFGRVYWHFRHEPCVVGWVKGSKPEHDGNHEFDSVWEIDWEGAARVSGNEHPTEKPVEIFARPMRKHTRPGDLVFEPFSGSGSQLIAAERLGRRCRAIEISPVFVDAAIRRWEKATGKEAILESTGESFHVTQERRWT